MTGRSWFLCVDGPEPFGPGPIATDSPNAHFSPALCRTEGNQGENAAGVRLQFPKLKSNFQNCTHHAANCTFNLPRCTCDAPNCIYHATRCICDAARCIYNATRFICNAPGCFHNAMRDAHDTARCTRNSRRWARNTTDRRMHRILPSSRNNRTEGGTACFG